MIPVSFRMICDAVMQLFECMKLRKAQMQKKYIFSQIYYSIGWAVKQDLKWDFI